MRRPIQSFNVPHGCDRAGRLTKSGADNSCRRQADCRGCEAGRHARKTDNAKHNGRLRNAMKHNGQALRAIPTRATQQKNSPQSTYRVSRGILLSPTVYSPPQHLSCFMKFRHNSGCAGQSAFTPSVCFRSDVLPRLTSAATCRTNRFRRFHNLLLGNRPQRTERSESRKTCGLFRRFGGLSPRQNGPLNFGFVHAGARAHYTLCRAKFFA